MSDRRSTTKVSHLLELLDTYRNSACGLDCKLTIKQDGYTIDVAVSECHDHDPCFVKTLAKQRTIQ